MDKISSSTHEIQIGIPSRNLPLADKGPASLKHLTQPLTIIYAEAKSWWQSRNVYWDVDQLDDLH